METLSGYEARLVCFSRGFTCEAVKKAKFINDRNHRLEQFRNSVVDHHQTDLQPVEKGSSQGVSKWLFIGQVMASAGFTVYSWLVGSWVFVVTNLLMLVSAFVGLGLMIQQRRRARPTSVEPKQARPETSAG